MSYKNWDNRRGNRGRGRGNGWNWRGRGHHRMPMVNTFIPNMGWTSTATNYNHYRLPHQEPNGYYYPRHPKPSSVPINNIITKTASPLPGSEEYTQNKIQQTSDLIKRQLNIDSETCSANDPDFPSNLDYSECSNNNSGTSLQDNLNIDSPSRLVDSRRITKQVTKRNKSPELIDVQEIHDKIIKHISNLSYSKKMNLVNQSTSVYDIAIQEVQRQKRLELSRALRDISKRQAQSSDDGEVINAIIPDIGIKIEDLPNDIIAKLSNSLNLHLDDHIPCLVDPEACFKQAEEILNVNCLEGDDDPSLKFFQHNLMINQDMNNEIGDGNEEFENIGKNAIPILDNNLLNKSQPEYPLCNSSFPNNQFREPPTSSQIQINESFIEGTTSQDDNEKSDDDYARDLEFNNFCFENFDFNKSYLVPAKPQLQDFGDTSTSSITPKISVRKDILFETNINDETQNMRKSETNSFSNVNLPPNVESPSENTKFINSGDTSHLLIQCDNNLPDTQNMNELTSINQTAINELLDLNRVESESNTDRNTNITPNNTSNLQNTEFASDIKETSPLLNEHDTTSDISLQIGNQASPNVNQFSQNLEYCTQKRWRSPGEKKMMADIQGKASVIVNAINMNIEPKQCPNLDDNVQNEPELQPPIVDQINADTVKPDEPSNNNLIVEVKSTREKLVEDEHLNICNKSKEPPVNIQLSVQNESDLNLNKEPIDQGIHNVGSETDSLEKLQETVHQKSPEHETKLTSKLSKPQTSVSEQNQNVKQKKAKPVNSKNTLKTSNNKTPTKDDKKDSLSVDIQITECNNKNPLNDINDADIKNKTDPDDSTPKEHRKIKTAAEKKETMPLSKSVSTIATQTMLNNTENVTSKITKNIEVQTMPELKSKTDSPKNAEKNDIAPVIKSVQSIHTQTIAETKLQIIEKKETPNPKTYKTVHVQTHLENNTSESAKIKIKECKNAEVQANVLLISSGVQTNVNLENYEKEVRTPIYINYILKLKKIDEEIENLLQAKKNLYKTIEDECKSSQSNDTLNIREKGEKRICIKEEAANIPHRKHKKTDSDNEFDDKMHNPKRKKRHRSSKKSSHSQINLYNKLSDPVNEVTDSNRTDRLQLNSAEISEDKRKPLSIKISLKNLKQSSSKQEFGDIPKKRIAEVITKKSTSGRNSTEGNGQNAVFDNVKSDLCTTKLPKRKNSTDRKLDNENINISKTSTSYKSPNCDNEVNNIKDQHTEEKHVKTNKSKKLKTVKHDLNNVKLSDHEKAFSKRCHVVIERCTIEYLEGLKRKLYEHNESPKDVFSLVPPHRETNEDKIISSTDCDKTDLEFKDFLGAVLDIKVLQEVLLAATDSGHLYFFDVSTGDVINSFSISEKPLTSIYTATSDQQCDVYVGCLMGVLTTLDFTSKNISNSIQCEEGIQCLEKRWEYIFMGSYGGLVMRYNFKKHKLEAPLKIYDSNILAIKATQEGARRVIIVASRSTEVTVRDAMSGLLLRVMDSTFYPTVYAMILKNNLVYCGTSQHDILVFTFQDGQLQFKYEAVNSKGIVCLKIAGDLLFAGCYNGNIYIYSVSSRKFLGQIAGPGGMLLSMEVHGSKIFVGTKGNKLKRLTIPEALLNETS